MAERIDLEIQHTVDDYARALMFMQQRQFFYKQRQFFYKYRYIILPLLTVISMLITALFSKHSNTALIITFVPFAIVFGLVIAFVASKIPNPAKGWFVKRLVSKQFKSSPALQAKQLIIYDDEGIKGTSNLTSSVIKWEAIVEALESEDDFFFYTSKANALFIPKKAFINTEQQNQLRDLVKRKIGDKAEF